AATNRKLGILTDDTLPQALIWDGNDGSPRRWLMPTLLGLVTAALVWLGYRRRRSLRPVLARLGVRPLFAAIGRPKLSLIMSLLFIGLSIPILIFILIYNYSKNSAAIGSILHAAVTTA